MANQQTCFKCGALMKYSQRTGKAYCSALCWKQNPTPQYASKPDNQEIINKAIEAKNGRIDKAIDRKEESIDVWASINNATAIVAQMKLTDAKEITEKIGNLAEGIQSIAKLMKRERVFKGLNSFEQDKYNQASEQDEAVIQLEEELEMESGDFQG